MWVGCPPSTCRPTGCVLPVVQNPCAVEGTGCLQVFGGFQLGTDVCEGHLAVSLLKGGVPELRMIWRFALCELLSDDLVWGRTVVYYTPCSVCAELFDIVTPATHPDGCVSAPLLLSMKRIGNGLWVVRMTQQLENLNQRSTDHHTVRSVEWGPAFSAGSVSGVSYIASTAMFPHAWLYAIVLIRFPRESAFVHGGNVCPARAQRMPGALALYHVSYL